LDRKFLRGDVALTGHRHILTLSEPRPAAMSTGWERATGWFTDAPAVAVVSYTKFRLNRGRIFA
jgi:hypothetical protein